MFPNSGWYEFLNLRQFEISKISAVKVVYHKKLVWPQWPLIQFDCTQSAIHVHGVYIRVLGHPLYSSVTKTCYICPSS